ncbi:MAG TPA: chemotaxis protein CheB [Mycobacteriales bacterium]|nr:chemotaxis protein CheB [Mycobacteriales bacterium]
MPRRDLVVVGASAGGVEALRDLVSELPADLPACVLVVLHLPSAAFSALSVILARATSLTVATAYDGAPLANGRIFVAPPDRHLVVRDGHVALGRGPKENGHRPAIDPLFRSAARWRGPNTIGVILSGTLDDGAAGLLSLTERGGLAVVQDPQSAAYDGMPSAALRAVPDAKVAAGPALAALVASLCGEAVSVDAVDPVRRLDLEADIARLDEEALAAKDRPGRPAALTCPDCNGAMFEIDDGNLVRYRCRVGHAWSPDTLLFEQVEMAEAALWAAIRTLEEKAALHRKMSARAQGEHKLLGQRYHDEQAEAADSSASVLRDLLRRPLTGDAPDLPPILEADG